MEQDRQKAEEEEKERVRSAKRTKSPKGKVGKLSPACENNQLSSNKTRTSTSHSFLSTFLVDNYLLNSLRTRNYILLRVSTVIREQHSKAIFRINNNFA